MQGLLASRDRIACSNLPLPMRMARTVVIEVRVRSRARHPQRGHSVRLGLPSVAKLKSTTAWIRRGLQVRVLGFDPAALPAPSVEYRGVAAASYDRSRAGRDLFQWEAEIVARSLQGMPDGARVLDAPVGTGRFIPIYLQTGLHATGVDLSPDMLREASIYSEESKGRLELILASTTSLPFPDDSFDALVSFRFLPGKLIMADVRRTLREFSRVTRGRALLLLKVASQPIERTWRDRWSRMGERTGPEIEALLGEAGFSIEAVEHAPHGPKALFTCVKR